MLHADAERFLRTLLQTPGPSGFEANAARVWRDFAASHGAEVSADVVGNSMAVFNPAGAPTVMFVGHLDEIGVIVQHIDDAGFVWIAPIGGWDPQVLVAQRIRFLGRTGEVVGVVGRKPVHLIKPVDREKGATIPELWVDLGARSRGEAEELVAVGDAGVIDAAAIDLANRCIASRSVDNRVGAFVVLEAARRSAELGAGARVVAVAASQEEIGYHGGGALVAARSMSPSAAFVVDVTFATDEPEAPKKEHGEHRIGGGPVISRGGIVSPALFDLLVSSAARHAVRYTVQASPGPTGTDADPIATAGTGVPVAVVSIPNRYMHSPNELVSLDDLASAITLLAEATRAITPGFDWTR